MLFINLGVINSNPPCYNPPVTLLWGGFVSFKHTSGLMCCCFHFLKQLMWHQRASEGWFSWTHIADLLLRLLQSQELRCVHDLAVSFPFILLKVLLVVNLQLETRQIFYSTVLKRVFIRSTNKRRLHERILIDAMTYIPPVFKEVNTQKGNIILII